MINTTPFRELRLAAGYKTQTALAQQLRFARRQITSWENGAQPIWRHIPRIAEVFQIDQKACISKLWNENIGDPCPCGCGGTRVYPRNEGAECLGIELSCTKCQRIRFHRQRGRGHHRVLCAHCWNTSERVAHVEFTCVGYDDHGKTMHAPKCFKKKRLAPYQIRRYLAKNARGISSQRAFLDEVSTNFRCSRCATAARVISGIEKKLKSITSERIKSRNQRTEILEGHADTILHPGFSRKFKPGQNWHGDQKGFKERRTKTSDSGKRNRAKGRLYKEWSHDALPKYEFGRCIDCRCIVIARSGRPALFHGQCYSGWQQTPEGQRYMVRVGLGEKPPLPSRPGQPVTAENLKLYFAWAIRHYLGGESYRVIAKMSGVDFSELRRNVKFIASNLPDPELLQSSFRLRISLLKDAISSFGQSIP